MPTAIHAGAPCSRSPSWPAGRSAARAPRAALARAQAVELAMRRAKQPGPNLDFGLVAFCCALGLPAGAAAAVFAVGRLPGWIAHALEQRRHSYVLRPRSRYVPEAPLDGTA